MSFARLVADLYARGVTYRATPDGRLRVEAPADALTEGDWAAIAARKDDLLFLCSGAVTIYGRGREPAWLRAEQATAAGNASEPTTDQSELRGAPVEAWR